MTAKNLYGIMIKYPEPGRVKTRLAREIGESMAAEICRLIAEQVLRNTVSSGDQYRRIIFIDPSEREADFRDWLPAEQFEGQHGRNLGERMDHAIRHLLNAGAEKAVITGTDIPKLNSDIVMQAFKALDQADVVIGPAADGGYYLIGMKANAPELFHEIAWSTSRVFSETLQALSRSGKSYRLLPILSDLDTAEDLNDIDNINQCKSFRI